MADLPEYSFGVTRASSGGLCWWDGNPYNGRYVQIERWAPDSLLMCDTFSEHTPNIVQGSVHPNTAHWPLSPRCGMNDERHFGKAHTLFITGVIEAHKATDLTRSVFSWEDW